MMTADISRALEIQGWMQPAELEWLAEAAKTHYTIVELGSFCGRSTRALGDNTPGYVLAFDDWQGPRDVLIEQLIDEQGNILDTKPASMESVIENWGVDLFSAFQKNLGDLIDLGKVKVLRGNHGDASIIPEIEPDMVFIDGDHDYESCLRDIRTWQGKLAKGGLLCGHDAGWDGVFRACVESFGGNWSTPPFTDIWFAYA